MNRQAQHEQRLTSRGWTPVHADKKEWKHKNLYYHWRTVDALRMESDRDSGRIEVLLLLGELDAEC